MSKLFWKDSYTGTVKSYDELLHDVIREGSNSIYVQNSNPYEVFLGMLRNFASNRNTVLLDSDFSESELKSLDIVEDSIVSVKYHQDNLREHFTKIEDLISYLGKSDNELSIDIYTSGTTGRPKKIKQQLSNLCRYVSVRKERAKDVWGFAYNVTHFAGLQVFFQAFMNVNPIIYVFGSDYGQNYDELIANSVTNLSCTPTYMKMLLPYAEGPSKVLKNVTFGGEPYDKALENDLKKKFGELKIRNVYASSEAGSLLCSDGDSFTIPERYEKLIRISDDMELQIHKTLLGKSKTLQTDDNWYNTGDLVEFVNTKAFTIKNRKSDFINVGGYKVNPKEVEEIMKNFPKVKDALVLGKKNSLLGNIVTANVIAIGAFDKKELKRDLLMYLHENLQEWKVPRVIKFVDNFELTRTGKIKKA